MSNLLSNAFEQMVASSTEALFKKKGKSDAATGQKTEDAAPATQSTKVEEAYAKMTSTVSDKTLGKANTLVARGIGTGDTTKKATGGASDVAQPIDVSNRTEILKVKIWDNSGNTLTFDIQPVISEARGATYSSFTPPHHPGEILKYHGTKNRTWSVTGLLASRTMEEATKNQSYLNLIRSWVMPYYGQGTAKDKEFGQNLGAPPPILTLSAYGDKMIGPVPVVLENYGWNFANDVDYIQTNLGTDPDNPPVPFPVLVDVSLTFAESYSPAEYSNFSLRDYRNGDLSSAFGN